MIKRASFWMTLFMLAIVASMVVMSFSYSDRARLFPLALGIPALIIGTIILGAEKWPRLLKPFDVNIGLNVKVVKEGVDAEEEVEGLKPGIGSTAKVRRALTYVAWVVGYVLAVLLVGFNPSNFLFPALYVRVHARTGWWKAIVVGAATALFMYALFQMLMKAEMFNGLLFGDYLPAI